MTLPNPKDREEMVKLLGKMIIALEDDPDVKKNIFTPALLVVIQGLNFALKAGLQEELIVALDDVVQESIEKTKPKPERKVIEVYWVKLNDLITLLTTEPVTPGKDRSFPVLGYIERVYKTGIWSVCFLPDGSKTQTDAVVMVYKTNSQESAQSKLISYIEEKTNCPLKEVKTPAR